MSDDSIQARIVSRFVIPTIMNQILLNGAGSGARAERLCQTLGGRWDLGPGFSVKEPTTNEPGMTQLWGKTCQVASLVLRGCSCTAPPPLNSSMKYAGERSSEEQLLSGGE